MATPLLVPGRLDIYHYYRNVFKAPTAIAQPAAIYSQTLAHAPVTAWAFFYCAIPTVFEQHSERRARTARGAPIDYRQEIWHMIL
ncbi:hypothetical protein [Tardiphaga sp. 42S5]|uniref:hypothetical protein n=1 Tax=Tardiphaga sp. 42S5 TaxID=1404799 RepID=UPI002A59A9FB|nr:hypothetical protein [Tardiphaga sp. 42S5]WPO43975.1 hypothetical protein SFY93_12820 [Tardiphaga sp. 42S5]